MRKPKKMKHEIIRAATSSGALDEAQSSVHTSCLLVLFLGRFNIIGKLMNVVHARISKP